MLVPLYICLIFAVLLLTVTILCLSKGCKLDKSKKRSEIVLKIYEKAEEILKISKADFVAFFKYKYRANFITTHFMFSMDSNGQIQSETVCGDLPVSISNFNIDVLRSDDKELHEFYKLVDSGSVREMYKNTYKVYFQNIFKNGKYPVGYITMSYSSDYKISSKEKESIHKIIDEIKLLI